jgi:CRP/FNR family transcriptional regulator, cyclic AMP receptor protein
VAKCLVQLADARGEPTETGVTVDLGLTQAAFAAMVGGSRPSVNQILRGIEDRGVVALDGQRVILKRLDHLRRRAGL